MSTPLINFAGLASGIDTNAIVANLMSIERMPRVRLAQRQADEERRQTALQDIQGRLQNVQAAAAELRKPGLFDMVQTATSSDPTRVAAQSTGGSGVGVYLVEVSQLAKAAQRTFDFASPVAADTVTIDGHVTSIGAGASIHDFVAAINSDADATVYAAALDADTVVLSNRVTGDTAGSYIQVTDDGGVIAEQAVLAREGQDALFTVDGVGGSSSSNTVTAGIAGVELTLKSLTTTGPVAIDVSAPAVDGDAVKGKLKAFVDVYNSTIDAIRTKLNEKTVPDPQTAADRAKGVLFGDSQLNGLLRQMRNVMYESLAGLPAEFDSLADIGISTGAPGASTSSALSGRLVIDDAKLDAALQSNPGAVSTLLGATSGTPGFSQRFDEIIDAAASDNGIIDARISGSDRIIKQLADQMTQLDSRLVTREASLRAQFARLEGLLAQSQAQGAWLTSQLAGLPTTA